MNYYFLVEGETEKEIYPLWLKYLMPHLKKVDAYDSVIENHYFIISGMGYPQLLNRHLHNAIQEINEIGRYDYLVIALDADEVTVEERQQEVADNVAKAEEKLVSTCQLQIIVQNRCLETWFMGNRTVFPRQPDDQFLELFQFYRVDQHDPEGMTKPDGFSNSLAEFHYHYLKKMLKQKKIHYSKKTPKEVGQAYYLQQLQKRITDEPTHLQTLQICLAFFQ